MFFSSSNYRIASNGTEGNGTIEIPICKWHNFELRAMKIEIKYVNNYVVDSS